MNPLGRQHKTSSCERRLQVLSLWLATTKCFHASRPGRVDDLEWVQIHEEKKVWTTHNERSQGSWTAAMRPEPPCHQARPKWSGSRSSSSLCASWPLTVKLVDEAANGKDHHSQSWTSGVSCQGLKLMWESNTKMKLTRCLVSRNLLQRSETSMLW